MVVVPSFSPSIDAIADFQRILDHPGINPLSVVYPVTYVQQARAFVLENDLSKAAASYEKFFELWKNADPDVPILQRAKAEYSHLH